MSAHLDVLLRRADELHDAAQQEYRAGRAEQALALAEVGSAFDHAAAVVLALKNSPEGTGK